ncbi:RtcB family protein [Sphingobacterium hungaricum]|uniref:3'-phosphate/5'-hydroxy nucleic acid ligase n=1 Tax=Sphingobacterium hungaricum TaxID=2082723 RepID=A0A928USP0_9SPHI|nr:RtcB family protein [Sphingobacterium hungaricum]MBE8712591.1 RNA-splicing ligase RtcB [Sphingobacterium hungaricum]
MKDKITGKHLLHVGFSEGKILGMALEIIENNFAEKDGSEVLALVRKVKKYPESFLDDEIFKDLATAILYENKINSDETIPLVENSKNYTVFGADYIEQGATDQMDIAMKLPVTLAGSLMPDAHQGYGLPIGGVLATRNAIIPYGVGVDIGCRMALSIFDIPEKHYFGKDAFYKRELIAHTKFGAGQNFKDKERADHEVLEDEAFNSTDFLKRLHGKAWAQLGTSGGGNHFVEFGIIDFAERDGVLNIDKGRYVALLTHSGSRGLGATIADQYTKLAKSICKLPKEAVNLAYLDLNTAEGQEYWIAMNLAGDYASACHEVIHKRLTKAIGAKVLAKVENHHNFAWKETLDGEEVIVHRKGATPAGKGVMGIIPGSMTAPGFLVRGKGEVSSINSASHGAGRQMSRSQAFKTIAKADMKAILKDHNVTLIGAGLDEAPMAYKDIHKVMSAQTELVDVVATFEPKMVRMADDGSRED